MEWQNHLLNVVAQAVWRMHLQEATWDLRSVTPYRLSGTEGVMDKETVQRDIQVQEGTAMLTRSPPLETHAELLRNYATNPR